MVFIPTMEVNIPTKKTIEYVSSITNRYAIVNVINYSYDDAIYVPEILPSYFELARKFQITLPEIPDIEGQLNIVERGLKNMYNRLFGSSVNQTIEEIAKEIKNETNNS